jgi:hypothetical protein
VAECTVHIDPAHAHRTAELLALPSRIAVLAQVQQVLHAPATVRLHYLDSGLGIEVELHQPLHADEPARLEQAVRATLGASVRLGRVRIVATPPAPPGPA